MLAVDNNHVSKVTRDLIKFYRATIEMSNRLQVLTGTGSVDVLDNSLTIEWSK